VHCGKKTSLLLLFCGGFSIVREFDKVGLKTNEIATIVEVLGKGEKFIAEIQRPSNGFSVTIADISPSDIVDVLSS